MSSSQLPPPSLGTSEAVKSDSQCTPPTLLTNRASMESIGPKQATSEDEDVQETSSPHLSASSKGSHPSPIRSNPYLISLQSIEGAEADTEGEAGPRKLLYSDTSSTEAAGRAITRDLASADAAHLNFAEPPSDQGPVHSAPTALRPPQGRYSIQFTHKSSPRHSIYSLDAVWREPLILPALKGRKGSVSTRDSVTKMLSQQPHTSGAGAYARTTLETAILPKVTQSAKVGAHTLQDSNKINIAEEGTSSPITIKESPPASKPRQEEHAALGGNTATTHATLHQVDNVESARLGPFSLWEYLKEEVLATDVDSTQEMRWDRVSNFMAVPWQCEKMILFGFVICLDSFLYTFTVLPLRFFVAISLCCRNLVSNLSSSGTPHLFLHSSHKCDILKAGLIIISCYILSRVTDASKMYHSVRGQETIKLYVIFNVLEIVDRLCCSLGQDLLDALFSHRTLARQSNGRQPFIRPLHLFALALVYIQIHTIVLFYQLVTLNVAINSYDNALLTLLLSNQFVEIKGSVFKKFEKENLFQMTCADVVERFQLTLILFAIGVRNLIEVTSGGDNTASTALRPHGPSGDVPLPRSFTVLPSLSVLATSFAPVVIVLGSECIVDWLKHAFITKFNHIRPSVYGRFMDVLCRDLVLAGPLSTVPAQGQKTNSGTKVPAKKVEGLQGNSRAKRRNTFVDQSPVLSRRLGFAALPLACLLARISVQIYGMLGDDSHFDECSVPVSAVADPGQITMMSSFLNSVLSGKAPALSLPSNSSVQILAWVLPLLLCWIFLIAVKVLLGTALISFAHYRYNSMASREVEEDLNNRNRPHIGVNSLEAKYEDKVKQVLGGADDATNQMVDRLNRKGLSNSGSLLDVNRYTMVKSRLW